jgi:hypothetical protein
LCAFAFWVAYATRDHLDNQRNALGLGAWIFTVLALVSLCAAAWRSSADRK